MKTVNLFIVVLMLTVGCSSKQSTKNTTTDRVEIPTVVGEWKHIFNPNELPERFKEDSTWYTNDHCFAKGPNGKWHAYGIIGHHPIDPWSGENKFFHVSADKFTQDKWENHDYALRAKKGKERVLWAPHIIKENGKWNMFYNIGNRQNHAPSYASWGQLCRAESADMFNWKRDALNPLFSDPGHARDSYILKDNGKYYYYYTKTFDEVDLSSCVAVRTSPDMKHWSGGKIAHKQTYPYNNWGGDAESPFVIKRGQYYYLFVCRALTEYNQTHVYWSKDPEHFPLDNFVTEIKAHAAELIEVSKGEWYISNTGWDKKGLFIAKLEWK